MKLKTTDNLLEYLSKIENTEKTLIICFHKSTDFINVRFEDRNYLIAFPLITERMKSKEKQIKDFINKIGLNFSSIAPTRLELKVNNVEIIKSLLVDVFDLTSDSELEYEIKEKAKPILHPKDYQIVKANCILIAIIIGLFSNWFWLFTITGMSFIGNFVILYNSISFQSDKDKTNHSPAVKGEITGQAITFAFFGLILTLVIGSIIRFLKITIF